MYKELLENLLKVLNDYHKREFDEENVYKSVDDIPTIIPIAYSNSENEKHGVQTNFNLNKLEWEEYIDDRLILVSKRNSLNDFVSELACADFDSIISDILFEANRVEEND